jgi:hypothetical protein
LPHNNRDTTTTTTTTTKTTTTTFTIINIESDMFCKIIRRFLLPVISLLYLIVLFLQLNDVNQLNFSDNGQVASQNYPQWTTNPSCDDCNDTKTHNGLEDTVQNQRNGSGPFQKNVESNEFAIDNGNKFQARSMDGVDSAHMARDGAWIDELSEIMKCNRQRRLDDSENSYARIPTKETWYVPGYWVGTWTVFSVRLLG